MTPRKFLISETSVKIIRDEVRNIYRDCVHTPGSSDSFKIINDTLDSVAGA
jgi:hypothetical protein